MGKNPFVTKDGQVIKNINELYLALSDMDDTTYDHHANNQRNDFSSWLKYQNFFQLASGVEAANSKEDATQILRKHIKSLEDQAENKHSVNIGKNIEGLKQVSETKLPENKLEKKKDADETEISRDISQTGIEELDKILNGGIPKGSNVLLAGSAGSGKTTLVMQWLYNGLRYKEPGVYFALTEPITKTIKNASSFDFYKPTSSKSSVYLTDLRSTLGLLNLKGKKLEEKDLDKVLDAIASVVKKTGARRVVIDSITAMCYLLEEKNLIRIFIFRLSNVLNDLECTTIMTSEVHEGKYSVFGVEEYISDGIIWVGQKSKKDDIYRTLKIAKMRGVAFTPETYRFKITRKGITLLRKMRPELSFPSSARQVTSGIEGLDDMLNGGFYEGSTTLISGAAGTGKSLIGLQFLYEGLKNKEKALIVSFEESKDQIMRNALNIGKDLKPYHEKGLLNFYVSYPSNRLPEEHILDIISIIEEKGIKRLVIDSLSAFASAFSSEDFEDFFKKLNIYLKHNNVTTIFTYAKSDVTGKTEAEFHTSTTTDNIMVLKYVEIDSEMRLMVSILKTRGKGHDKKLREYMIDDKGTKIMDSFKDVEGVFSGKTSRKVDSKLAEAFEKLAKGQ